MKVEGELSIFGLKNKATRHKNFTTANQKVSKKVKSVQRPLAHGNSHPAVFKLLCALQSVKT
jgi:hypothetical protein